MSTPLSVWIVTREWNQPHSQVADTGVVGVFTTEAAARQCQQATQEEHHENGDTVAQYSMREGMYHDDGICDRCGADLKDTDSCDNDHDEWDVDIQCQEYQVQP